METTVYLENVKLTDR